MMRLSKGDVEIFERRRSRLPVCNATLPHGALPRRLLFRYSSRLRVLFFGATHDAGAPTPAQSNVVRPLLRALKICTEAGSPRIKPSAVQASGHARSSSLPLFLRMRFTYSSRGRFDAPGKS